jgi:hypothetical protein
MSKVGEVDWQDTRAAMSSGCRVNRMDEDAMERWLVVRVGGEAERRGFAQAKEARFRGLTTHK